MDHFKTVNDQYGHAAGDALLLQLKDRLRSVTRALDFVVRWGGEEFLIAFRRMSREKGKLLADLLLLSVSCAPRPESHGTLSRVPRWRNEMTTRHERGKAMAQAPAIDRSRDVLHRQALQAGCYLGSIGDYERLAGVNTSSEEKRRALWWQLQSMFRGPTQALFDAVMDHCATLALQAIQEGRLCLLGDPSRRQVSAS